MPAQHRDSEFLRRRLSEIMVKPGFGGDPIHAFDDLITERDNLQTYIANTNPMRHQLFQKAIEKGASFEQAVTAGGSKDPWLYLTAISGVPVKKLRELFTVDSAWAVLGIMQAVLLEEEEAIGRKDVEVLAGREEHKETTTDYRALPERVGVHRSEGRDSPTSDSGEEESQVRAGSIDTTVSGSDPRT